MFSIVINSIDPVKFSSVSAMYGRVLAGHEFEIVGIRDAKSAAEGYTRGVAASRGDVVILSHDDIEFLCADLGQRVRSHLNQFDIVGIAGTCRLTHPMWSWTGPPNNYGQVAHGNPDGTFHVEIFSTPATAVGGIQAVDSVFMACRRQAVVDLGFDPVRYTHFHCYEADFCVRALERGLKIAVACDLPAIHNSVGRMDQSWADAARMFMQQHGMKLPPFRERRFDVCKVLAKSRQDVFEIMCPPHFPQKPVYSPVPAIG
jgi:hypothetical protein